MSYVDKNLLEGEQVVYRTRRHAVIFLRPVIFIALGAALLLFVAARAFNGRMETGTAWAFILIAGLLVLIGLLTGVPAVIDRLSSEFAVTNKRVILKVGWIRRRSLETLLSKIEAIEVLQVIWGRVLNYGTIIVIGTGGTQEPFTQIAAPLEFRRKVQEQIIAFSAK